jgi:hypothetical protein
MRIEFPAVDTVQASYAARTDASTRRAGSTSSVSRGSGHAQDGVAIHLETTRKILGAR